MQITPLKIKAPFSLGLTETTKSRKDKTKLEKAGINETNFQGPQLKKIDLNQDLLVSILGSHQWIITMSHPKVHSLQEPSCL